MFEATSRLATVYVDLCKAGDSRYIGWKKEARCCLDRGLDEFNAVIRDVEETCKAMENDLMEWKKTLHLKRWTYPNFNYFTVQQLLYLQQQLVGLSKNPLQFVTKLPTQVYTLLELIYPNISRDVLKSTIYSAMYELEYGQVVEEGQSWKQVDQPEDRFITVSAEQIAELLCLLESEGLPDSGAMAAVNACTAEGVDEAAVWYYENEDDDELLKKLADEMKEILAKKKEEEKGNIMR